MCCELSFPELPLLGMMVFASVSHLVLEALQWILKLCCRDWREIEHQVSAGLCSSSMSSVPGWHQLQFPSALLSLALVPFPWRDLGTQQSGAGAGALVPFREPMASAPSFIV